jgi:hypothetical protein
MTTLETLMTAKAGKKKTTKKVAEKTFKGTEIAYFDVIAKPVTTDDNFHLWGIGETKDINILKHLNDEYNGVNRKVAQPHKGVVGKAMLDNGYAGGISVCIHNNTLYRVDGNHRAEFLSDNGYPIRFAYRHVESFEQLVKIMIDFNDSAKNWGVKQYINTYASTGSKAYTLLQEMGTKHGLTPTTTASLIGNVSITLAKRQIRMGELTYENKEAAISRVLMVSSFLERFGQKDQRPTEGLMLFINSIDWNEFRSTRKAMVERAIYLVSKGYLIGKGTPNARDYERLFIDAQKSL